MGCCASICNKNPQTVHTVALGTSKNKSKDQNSSEKSKYIEYTDDIQCIRRAAKNMCLLSNYDWHIDSIKKDWDITVKDWSSFDFSGTSVKDSKNYLDIRFQQSIELLQNSYRIHFPVTINNSNDIAESDEITSKSYYRFKLALVICSDKNDIIIANSNTKKQKAHRKYESISCESLFIVAAEQKGTECKLITAHALINISAFRKSIGLPLIVHKQLSNVDDLMYDLSYGLDGECSV